MFWSIANLPRLADKVVVVTGASSGTGEYVTEHLALAGATVVLAVRNTVKGENVKNEIAARIAARDKEKDVQDKLMVMEVDLSRMHSVRTFAKAFKQRFNQLDVLVNNAGVMGGPFTMTEAGRELHWATNHLGHFLLTGLLLDRITNTPQSRIVNVSSMGHKSVRSTDYEMLKNPRKERYNGFGAYVQTKAANILFTNELQRRLSVKGSETKAISAHPGISSTNLGYSAHFLMRTLARLVVPLVAQSAEGGALPITMAATDPEAKGGDYYGPGGLFEARGPPKKVKPSEYASNPGEAKKLWGISEELVDLKYLQVD